MERLIGILIAILALGIMVTIHELGHYLVGRALGFKIVEFMIFMGPKLFSWERGGIKYSIRLIPLGAAVEFAGEYQPAEDEADQALYEEEGWEPDDPGLFMNRPKRYRAAVLAAGSLANILAGILIFFGLFAARGFTVPRLADVPAGSQAAAAGLEKGDELLRVDGDRIGTNLDAVYALYFAEESETIPVRVKNTDGTRVDVLLEPEQVTSYQIGITIDGSSESIQVIDVADWQNGGSPVFQEGDRIIELDGVPVNSSTFGTELAAHGTAEVPVTIIRDGKEQVVHSSSRAIEGYTERGILNMANKRSPLQALPYAFEYAWSTVRGTVKSLGAMFAGQVSVQDSLTGPVGIVDMLSGVVSDARIDWGIKFLELLNMTALIMLALGLTNLLPIPLLDGNHLLLLLIEAIRGKPLSRRTQGIISAVGLVLIIGLFGLGLFVDFSRIINRQ